MEQLKKMLQDVNVILQKEKVRKEEITKRGEHFNMFEMLGVAHHEVTHSKIIAGFLNPKGSHGQGDLFLRLFLQTIENNDEIAIETSNANVYTEYDTGDGRIDILIEDNTGRGIIIENKVYAGDQPEQLIRYNSFAKNKYKNYTIYYLTLYGYEASNNSANGVTYKCISYSEHIIRWLQKCIHECATMPLIRETLVQYMNHTKQLTNQNMDSLIQGELIEVLASKDYFKQSLLIGNNIKNIKKHIVSEQLKPQIKKSLSKVPDCSIIHFEFGEGNYSQIQIKVSSWEKALIIFEFDSNDGTDNLVYGVFWPDGRPSTITLEGFKSNNKWAWKNHHYNSWNTETFIDVFNGKVAESFINSIEEILNIVKESDLSL